MRPEDLSLRWKSTSTNDFAVAEAWRGSTDGRAGRYACRIHRIVADEGGGYTYAVTLWRYAVNVPVYLADGTPADSFEAAERGVLDVLCKREAEIA